MPNVFPRMVALLLVPCLVTDPTFSITLLQSGMFDGHYLPQKVYTAEAIVPSSYISRRTDPEECPAITEMVAAQKRLILSRGEFIKSLLGFLAFGAATGV